MSKLFINESEVSQIHKMYLIEGESDKQDGTNMRASQGFWDLIKFEEGDPKKPIGRRFLGEWKAKELKTYMLTQGQFDSLISLVFNTGCDSVRMSRFIQYVKLGQYIKAAESILLYKSSNDGLKNRRTKEKNMFIS